MVLSGAVFTDALTNVRRADDGEELGRVPFELAVHGNLLWCREHECAASKVKVRNVTARKTHF